MKKIPSLFVRDYDDVEKLVIDQVLPGSEWVQRGEGIATVKWDGTACMVRDGKLFKRYDRKRDRKTGEYKAAPDGWEACQEPDAVTGHWPGWVLVGDGPEDKWFAKAWKAMFAGLADGTYELCGPHFQNNPHNLNSDMFIRHGSSIAVDCPTGYEELREFFSRVHMEGVVWHHPDGRMVKIKTRDFGLDWPMEYLGGTY